MRNWKVFIVRVLWCSTLPALPTFFLALFVVPAHDLFLPMCSESWNLLLPHSLSTVHAYQKLYTYEAEEQTENKQMRESQNVYYDAFFIRFGNLMPSRT